MVGGRGGGVAERVWGWGGVGGWGACARRLCRMVGGLCVWRGGGVVGV
jgi:hypothetical protein